jgi:hypothetical protein
MPILCLEELFDCESAAKRVPRGDDSYMYQVYSTVRAVMLVVILYSTVRGEENCEL